MLLDPDPHSEYGSGSKQINVDTGGSEKGRKSVQVITDPEGKKTDPADPKHRGRCFTFEYGGVPGVF
jgi:hypothetical protein